MKISAKHLENVLYKLKYDLYGYSGLKDDQDFEVDISITNEDPGNGVMTECFTLTSRMEHDDEDKGETIVSMELYPYNEKLDPVASKTQSYKVRKKY